MNILIISHLIYPANNPRAFRTTELAKELSRQGHNIILYSVLGSYSYEEYEKEFRIKIKNIGRMLFATLNSDDKNKYSLFTRILNRMFNRLLEFPNIELMFKIPGVISKEADIDLLISVAAPFPIHWGCALSKTIRKKSFPTTWIADCGDPYMGNNKFQEKKKYFYFKYIEKWFCRLADYITVPFDGAIDGYYEEFREKIRVIPQGFNFNEITLDLNHPDNEIPTFAYSGVFFREIRNPSAFLDYLTTIDREFKFIIYTKTPDILKPYIPILGKKLEIHEYIPRKQLIFELSKMDFLINFENKTEIHSPSKLIDYALTKKPVLSISSGSLNIETINEFLKGVYTNRFIVNNIEQYDISNVARQFITLCNKQKIHL